MLYCAFVSFCTLKSYSFDMLIYVFICFHTLLYAFIRFHMLAKCFYMLLKAKVSQQQEEMMLALCITGFCFAEAGKKRQHINNRALRSVTKQHGCRKDSWLCRGLSIVRVSHNFPFNVSLRQAHNCCCIRDHSQEIFAWENSQLCNVITYFHIYSIDYSLRKSV